MVRAAISAICLPCLGCFAFGQEFDDLEPIRPNKAYRQPWDVSVYFAQGVQREFVTSGDGIVVEHIVRRI